jgi:allophanate hydrolase subunit 2
MQDASKLTKLVQDAGRCVMYHKGVTKSYLLQTYASALLFTLIGSVTRRLFQHKELKRVTIKPAISDG